MTRTCRAEIRLCNECVRVDRIIFSFQCINSFHRNPWRRTMLVWHLLVLLALRIMIVGIAWRSRDLRREVRLLLWTLTVMWLRGCIRSHGGSCICVSIMPKEDPRVLTVGRLLWIIDWWAKRSWSIAIHWSTVALVGTLVYHGSPTCSTWTRITTRWL